MYHTYILPWKTASHHYIVLPPQYFTVNLLRNSLLSSRCVSSSHQYQTNLFFFIFKYAVLSKGASSNSSCWNNGSRFANVTIRLSVAGENLSSVRRLSLFMMKQHCQFRLDGLNGSRFVNVTIRLSIAGEDFLGVRLLSMDFLVSEHLWRNFETVPLTMNGNEFVRFPIILELTNKSSLLCTAGNSTIYLVLW